MKESEDKNYEKVNLKNTFALHLEKKGTWPFRNLKNSDIYFFVGFLKPEEYEMPVSTINSRLQKLCSVDVGAMSQILQVDSRCVLLRDNAINAIFAVQYIL